jgi:hypothetical protein
VFPIDGSWVILWIIVYWMSHVRRLPGVKKYPAIEIKGVEGVGDTVAWR